jgi:hypothetical protein
MLQLGMKCWNLAFNAKGLKLIIVGVKVKIVKIYVVVREAFRKKKRQDETQFTTEINVFLSFGPS